MQSKGGHLFQTTEADRNSPFVSITLLQNNLLLFGLGLVISTGPFKCYVTQMGVGGVRFSGKKRYEGVMFNVISVTRGWVGVQFAGK